MRKWSRPRLSPAGNPLFDRRRSSQFEPPDLVAEEIEQSIDESRDKSKFNRYNVAIAEEEALSISSLQIAVMVNGGLAPMVTVISVTRVARLSSKKLN